MSNNHTNIFDCLYAIDIYNIYMIYIVFVILIKQQNAEMFEYFSANVVLLSKSVHLRDKM